MAKAADVVVQCLENEGVEYVFGIPGEENLDRPAGGAPSASQICAR